MWRRSRPARHREAAVRPPAGRQGRHGRRLHHQLDDSDRALQPAALQRKRLLEAHPRLKGRVEYPQAARERRRIDTVGAEKVAELLWRQLFRVTARPDEAFRALRLGRVIHDRQLRLWRVGHVETVTSPLHTPPLVATSRSRFHGAHVTPTWTYGL
eukprot:374754-Prymnesium_polylepis.1